MNVLQIHNYYKIRGGECVVVDSEKDLIEDRGDRVLQFVADSGEIDGFSAVKKLKLLLGIPYNFSVAHSLQGTVRDFKPDVAHVHNLFPMLSPSVYGILHRARIPIVQTVHNYRMLCPNGQFFIDGEICEECQKSGFVSAVRKKCVRGSRVISSLYALAIQIAWWSKTFTNKIDRYLALNSFVAVKLLEAGIPKEKIRVCPNYTTSHLSEPLKKKPYCVYCGRLSAEKGLWTLFNAMLQGEGFSLKVAGTGPIGKNLSDFVKKNSQLDIELLGYVRGEEKERLIGQAMCMIVPSEWYENCPLSVLEALALGTPVIASNIGGLPELVQHNRTGLLFPPGDPLKLASCLRQICLNEREALRMARNALDVSFSTFSADKHHASLISIYKELVET